MKTKQKTLLDFTKSSIAELNENQLVEIDGGTSLPCIVTITSSRPCVDVITRATSITKENDEL